MVRYGFINNEGNLVSKILEEYVEQRLNEKQELASVTITVEEQIVNLSGEGWKPIDLIDEAQLKGTSEFESVRIQPFDNGDTISYHYIRSTDPNLVRKKIDTLKTELSDSDYKVIKCNEANLTGKTLPYDIMELSNERQNLRDKISELELLL